ncbi:dihydroxyacetone kinase family protein [Micromonospora cremea]|uniref:Homodimeric dihydroxyacetone kinase n=1 Tax=Micromonospora cremea TaxID=709881 RepID=A0A1N5TTJ3_9ACTN|nr:dihydroxyacetone kinase family protein [Micromonospora cremea]SIM51425.1 homodimeric dihydroxyacetone kinase [Micromonospora cremea]
MTKLYDDPDRFSDDMLAGFLDAHADRVVGVPGGVVRATETPAGKVAVVVGGGSGHYPAFCGVVGPGFADGAVVGNIFTSPSAQEAYTVGRAAANTGGLLFSTGNYAGDVMNFTLAQQKLQQEGVDTRVVFVTDDIASAPATEIERRRGIAGDFVVFKVAGAAAEAGYDLDGVERVARLANDRTRTLGVAFAGCTLPGAATPLFDVADGTMGVGLGIHGEPGIEDAALPSAADLARQLVDGVLAEAPQEQSRRIGVILNGLGATKYEELFVLWRTVARLLRDAGYTIVDPEVGELVTSLDMAGCSLTVVYLDEELERLWHAPADTPAYRKGVLSPDSVRDRRTVTEAEQGTIAQGVADDATRAAADIVVAALSAMAAAVADKEEELGRIDAVAGDGDHGRGMVRGTAAAVDAARKSQAAGNGPGRVLVAAGEAWAARAGGTSGVLWGAALAALGSRIGDGKPDATAVVEGVRASYGALTALGGAKPGDKTMLDALLPFADSLAASAAAGEPLTAAWTGAAQASEEAAQATAQLRPQVGRARPLAEKSVGTPDAGAVSMALCLRVVGGVLADTRVNSR